MLSVAALAYGIVQGPERGWTDPAVLGGFVVAAVGAATLILRSRRHPEPVLPLHLFADRGFVCANVVAVLFSVAFFAMFFGLVLFVNEAWDEPTGTAGLLITPALLTAAAFSFLGGRRADRVGHRLVMIPGSLAFSLGAVLLALGAGPEPELWLWIPALVLLGAGVGAVFPSFQSGAVHRVSEGEFAVAAATVQTNSRIAGTLGVAIAVVLVGAYVTGDPVDDFDGLWLLLAALGVVAAVVSLGIDTRQRPTTLAADPD
jgi:MFS family permease